MKQSEFAEKLAELEKKFLGACGEAARWKDEWIKAEQEKSKGMADAMERGKLEKILLIVNLITAGKANEAIQELLKPLPMIFALDIRFADDKSRIAAEKEMLEKLKKLVVGTVQSAQLKGAA